VAIFFWQGNYFREKGEEPDHKVGHCKASLANMRLTILPPCDLGKSFIAMIPGRTVPKPAAHFSTLTFSSRCRCRASPRSPLPSSILGGPCRNAPYRPLTADPASKSLFSGWYFRCEKIQPFRKCRSGANVLKLFWWAQTVMKNISWFSCSCTVFFFFCFSARKALHHNALL